jgi:NAD(P)-dependent dehydrogenase (short-subunit alcohol dehydrogenase family)
VALLKYNCVGFFMMVGSYTNKTVIVTGGAGGLGLAIVQKFLSEGANVVATDVQDELLKALPEQIDAEQRDRLLPYKADSTSDAEVEKLVADILLRFGRLDVLVNNAGVNDNMEPAADCPRALWDKNILVNLTGPFITTQHAIRQFLKQDEVNGQRGVILNVISAAGNHGYRAGR